MSQGDWAAITVAVVIGIGGFGAVVLACVRNIRAGERERDGGGNR